jgi:uncharacterized protein (TIGR00299 family) protein
MTRIAYLDCFSGISGDMLLGALAGAGVRINDLRSELAKLRLSGYRVEQSNVTRAGLAATKVDVLLEEAAQPHRRLPDILSLINRSALPQDDRQRAAAVFSKLAEAEARVHGVEPEAVDFHEVGAVDAIVDIVGVVIGLRLLGVEQLYCSPLPSGSGSVLGAHGTLPVPAPATLELLAQASAPITASDVDAELVTPTGAAIVSTLARFERPAMTVETLGYGAGARDLDGRPNVLRLWSGTALAGRVGTMQLIETNIDDMNPEVFGYIQERLLDLGAADVWLQPVQMKKNRPGVMLSVLCAHELEDVAVGLILSETSTLGVRVRQVERHEAAREEFTFESSLGAAAVKVKRLPGRAPVCSPEYEVCAGLARRHRLPLLEVYRIVQNEALARLQRQPS